MTKLNLNNGNETKLDIFFYKTYSNRTPFLFLSQSIKLFNDVQDQSFSDLWLK